MAEAVYWIKVIFALLLISTVAVLIMMAKISEIRNLLKGKGGHL